MNHLLYKLYFMFISIYQIFQLSTMHNFRNSKVESRGFPHPFKYHSILTKSGSHITCICFCLVSSFIHLNRTNDAFSRNLDNWPKQKSNFLWKQIHSKTLFLVNVICSSTSLKVWPATLQEFFVDANVFPIYGHCFYAFIFYYISTKFD